MVDGWYAAGPSSVPLTGPSQAGPSQSIGAVGAVGRPQGRPHEVHRSASRHIHGKDGAWWHFCRCCIAGSWCIMTHGCMMHMADGMEPKGA